MAEHEVTEAMVEAVQLNLRDVFEKSGIDPDTTLDRSREAIEAALAARTTPQPTDASAASGAVDVEHMLRECVPGGDICDPQHVADAIREYFDTHPTGAGADADSETGKPVSGWVLVPREPTEDMLVEGQEAWAKARHKMPRSAIEDCDEANAVYKAMLASSPQQRAEDGETAK